MISYVCLFLIMPAGVSRRAAVFMNLDGIVSGALRQRRLFREVGRDSADTEYDTILVDAGLVLEGVGPHDGLVGLDGHARVLFHHIGRGCNMYRIDPSTQVRTTTTRPLRPEVRRALQGQGHDDLLEGRVAGPFSNSVNCALDLAGTMSCSCYRIGRGQPEVVLAVRREHNSVRFFT